jgi:hypothetical protein
MNEPEKLVAKFRENILNTVCDVLKFRQFMAINPSEWVNITIKTTTSYPLLSRSVDFMTIG